MDAVQKLICKAVGDERNYQSVLSAQRKVGMTFGPVNHDHIQLLHDGSLHWFLSFYSGVRIQTCDNLKSSLNRLSIKCVCTLYKNVVGHTHFCISKWMAATGGTFAIEYVVKIFDGKLLMEAVFDANEMQRHIQKRKHIQNQRYIQNPGIFRVLAYLEPEAYPEPGQTATREYFSKMVNDYIYFSRFIIIYKISAFHVLQN